MPSVIVMDSSPYLGDSSKRPNVLLPEFKLDCEYDVPENENNFYLKWFLNNVLVYQWIPPRAPTALSLFKNRIKKNFTVSEDPIKMHRAVFVIKPTLNFSGEYSCSVNTFQSSDKKSSHLQIIGECVCRLQKEALSIQAQQAMISIKFCESTLFGKWRLLGVKLTFIWLPIGFRSANHMQFNLHNEICICT